MKKASGSPTMRGTRLLQRTSLSKLCHPSLFHTLTCPRKISQHILQSPIETVIDAFCGVGGNTIQFALSASCKRVIAIDTNPTAILCAKHNAHIYGVLDKIEFIVGDFFELVNAKESILKADAVFLSPPWGGPTYRNDKIFDLDTMLPYSAYVHPPCVRPSNWSVTNTGQRSFIFTQASKISKNIALYIPRTSNLNQVAELVPEGQKIQAVHYCVQKRSKVFLRCSVRFCTTG